MPGFTINFLNRLSIKARVTAFTLGIFVLSLWTLAYYASYMLRHDMVRLLGEQQMSAVTMVANEINDEMHDGKLALEKLAQHIDSGLMANPAALQAQLERSVFMGHMFNSGIFVTDLHGTAIADAPRTSGRVGRNFSGQQTMELALHSGAAVVGRPIIGRTSGTPAMAIVVGIQNSQGQKIGTLVGVINIGEPGFLDKIAANSYGKTGAYVLADRATRTFITGTEKNRILTAFPSPGISKALDRFAQGYEGSQVYVNHTGVEVMASAKGIPAAGWILGATLPTQEAFSPILAMQQNILLATLLLTLLAAGFTWWMLRRELSPMMSTVQFLADTAQKNTLPHALPVTTDNEIGQLLGGFNQLLKSLHLRDAAISESEAFKSGILNALTAHVAVLDHNGVIIAVNNAWLAFAMENSVSCDQPTGHTGVGVNYLDICQGQGGTQIEGGQDARVGILQVMQRNLASFQMEYPCHSPTEQRWFNLSATPLGAGGVVIAHTNITQNKVLELELVEHRNHLEHMVATQTSALQSSVEAMRESESMFRLLALNTSDGLAVFENSVIVYVSPSYLGLLGFEREEEIGRGADAIKDLIHPDDADRVLGTIHAAMQDKLLRSTYSYRAKHKQGHYIWREDTARFTYDDTGRLHRTYVVAKDITDRVEIENKLKKSTDLLERTGEVAKIGDWEVDLRTLQVDWSDQIYRIFEVDTGAKLSVQQAVDFCVPQSRSMIREAMTLAIEQGVNWDLELEAITAMGHRRWIRSQSQLVREAGTVVRLLGSVHDVTAEVLQRNALAEHQQSLQVCFDNLQVGVGVFSEIGLLYCNPAFRSLLGYNTTESLDHLNMDRLAPMGDQSYMHARHKRAKAYRETLPPKLMKLRCKDDATLTCLVSGAIISWNGEDQFLASATPLGSDEKVEQELRASEERFERLLVEQLEDQQAAIARELHDSLGSRLAGVAMLLGGIRQKRPEAEAEIGMALDQIHTAVEVSRTLARGLMPVDASPGAFWRALERLCLDYQRMARVQCLFSMQGDFDGIDADTGNHLYRIAQEALVNAVKHGHATTIQVNLEERPDALIMSIIDNGAQVKAEHAAPHSSSGVGLKSMQARAKGIGAAFRWFVNESGGITVSIALELHA